MDVHARLRSAAGEDVVPRFNERFILSLSTCESCCVCDDELNILPISKHVRRIEPLAPDTPADADGGGDVGDIRAVEMETTAATRQESRELRELQDSLKDVQPAGALVGLARTTDQARALMTFVQAVGEKKLRNTVSLTAARGRGKSAALGLAIASAVAHDYSNIFVTAPSPENLGTVFEFVLKGLEALHFKEHADYSVVQSTVESFNKAIVRINLFKSHRQTVQYVQPQDAHMLAQAELVVIDEAAAIPLPLVRALLGPYLVFISSTVNGYEGTGRSLSLKLLSELRQQQSAAAAACGRQRRSPWPRGGALTASCTKSGGRWRRRRHKAPAAACCTRRRSRRPSLRCGRRAGKVGQRSPVPRRQDGRSTPRERHARARRRRPLLRGPRRALLVPQAERALLAAHDGALRVITLQEPAQRPPAHVRCSSTSALCTAWPGRTRRWWLRRAAGHPRRRASGT